MNPETTSILYRHFRWVLVMSVTCFCTILYNGYFLAFFEYFFNRDLFVSKMYRSESISCIILEQLNFLQCVLILALNPLSFTNLIKCTFLLLVWKRLIYWFIISSRGFFISTQKFECIINKWNSSLHDRWDYLYAEAHMGFHQRQLSSGCWVWPNNPECCKEKTNGCFAHDVDNWRSVSRALVIELPASTSS